jgi:hypothetical protein
VKYLLINVILAIFASLLVLALSGVNIAMIVMSSEQNSLQRYCVNMEEKVVGVLPIRTNEKEIAWDLQYKDLVGVVIGLAIHGPIQPGQSDGPLAVALCGLDTTLACDLSVANVLTGTIDETGSYFPLQPIIQAFRLNPTQYKIKTKTSANMTGEVEARLGPICGTPS